MRRKLPVKAGFLLLVIFMLNSGCAGMQPAPKPAPQGEEPVVSVFFNATGEKKNLKMEEYIQGVVAAEMDTGWPVNALAAQAILARTFAMKDIETGRVKELHGTDVSTSEKESQAYDASEINDNVREAVRQTRGQVVTYKGDLINAWFSACDGGISATAEEGLAFKEEPVPYIKGGVKDGCLAITKPENKAWEAKIPLDQVRTAVQKITGKDPGAITAVAVQRKGPSGRAEQIKIGEAVVAGPALRNALGSERIRSTLLSEISIDNGMMAFSGKGFGHGVGMCQWGAKLLAEKGKSAGEIVEFYFKDIKIEQKWS
jgi:stage II sporulation protein D